jgi:hypothetical protein
MNLDPKEVLVFSKSNTHGSRAVSSSGIGAAKAILFLLLLTAVLSTIAWAGWGWKTLPSDADINLAAQAAVPSRSVESWTTTKHHDASQSSQAPLWVNQVVLSWIELNPNFKPCNSNDPDCTPTTKYWCGHSNLSFENDWLFDLGDPTLGVDDLSQCMGFIGYADGWIGTDNRSPTVNLSIISQAPDRVELFADASDPDGDTLTYTWYVDEGRTTATKPEVFWTDPPQGSHTILVVVTDGNGGSAEDRVSFTIGSAPKRYVIAPGFKQGEGPHLGFIKEVFVDGKEDETAKNTLLYAGTRLKTGPGVEIVVQWPTGAISRVTASTELEIKERTIAITSTKVVMQRLFDGIYHFYWPKGHEGAEKYEIATQRAIVGIEGTRLTVSHLNGVTSVEVQEGQVEVTDVGTGAASTVSEGQSASFDGAAANGKTIESALDTDGNGKLGDGEMTQAITYWILGQTVPNTNETISDSKILQLIQKWILGTSIA